jgi:hypothetical protein
MAKKLYEVKSVRVIYVHAESPREAKEIAEANEEECDPTVREPREITEKKDLSLDWYNAHPFTEVYDKGYELGDPTCAEILSKKGD